MDGDDWLISSMKRYTTYNVEYNVQSCMFLFIHFNRYDQLFMYDVAYPIQGFDWTIDHTGTVIV